MRKSGILLHPTSLPGKYGVGDIGESAYQFVDFLCESGQRIWQVLPLSPPGYGDSPYQSTSSMAGNPLLISLDTLAEENCLNPADLEDAPSFPASYTDFGSVIPYKNRMLKKAACNFFARASSARMAEFKAFCVRMESWLDKFAAFSALKEENGGVSWTEWKKKSNPDPVDCRDQKFIQFEFFRQWKALKEYCGYRGIEIVGDMPIFVAHDSADVWGNPELFDLDRRGHPRTIAGVPPDYFSKTGQCWGNPLYRWEAMAETGYSWWIERARVILMLVDLARLDHFRGFEKYYEIPGGSATAVRGRWVEGPGDRFFAALKEALGRLPFIAEDLGYITPEVHALRERWGFPGMRVLQFAFGDESPSHQFKPHNFVRNTVAYTGTHDNDTTVGWFHNTDPAEGILNNEQVRIERENALKYVNSDGREIHWDFIRLAVASVADTAIFPLQDALGLGSEARMNRPATTENNWRWRYEEGQISAALAHKLRELAKTYGRC
jgi:4-alpha-glucanotransferase